MAADSLETLGQLCWPYKSLPPELREAALRESEAELKEALSDLRKPDAAPELLAYALRRVDRCRDYGREPLDLHVQITAELWRMVQEPRLGYWLRRKCVGALQHKLRGIRKQFLPVRGLRPMPHQSVEASLAALRETLSWRTVQNLLLGELERTSRGAPLEPPSSAHHLAESLAGLLNELRHWTGTDEAEEVVNSLDKFMDPSQRSLVLFGRLMLMALPTEASLKFIQDGRLFRWWDLLPRGANPRFSLMWIALPARAAKVRWASGEPWKAEPVLPHERLCALLDIVAGTMCLPVDGSRHCDMDQFAEDCQWAFLGKTTYRLVAKYLVYSLEPLQDAGQPFPENSMWAALQMLCRRLAACTIHTGAWTWHVRTFLCELCRSYYVRVCRERYQQPGCLAHESCLMTSACDDAFVKLMWPLLTDTLTLQAGGHDHLQTSTTSALAFVSRLAMMNSQRWEEVKSFAQDAVQDLADPMSVRHSSTFHLLTTLTPLLVYATPGLILEAADLALPGIDPTDPMKTMVACAFFVNLFVQVPTRDLSLVTDLPDNLPSVLGGVLPLPPKGGQVVDGATPGDLQMVTSTFPDLCHNLLERFLEYVQAQPKPSKKDAMAALELAGPRLLSTAIFLAIKQADASVVNAMVERVAEWVSLTLLPNAVKAVGMLVGAFALANTEAAGKIMDKAIGRLQLGSGNLSSLGETEALWHLHVLGAAARFGGTSLPPRKAALEARVYAALDDKRKAVRRAGAKLCRRILAGCTAPYSGDLTGDGTVAEAMHRWAGARSLEWGSSLRPIAFHAPTVAELDFAHVLCEKSVEIVKSKAQGSDEEIHTALSLMKSVLRGVACLYPDERQGEEAMPLVNTLPNLWGPKLVNEFSEVLLKLCPKLGCPGHPFQATAAEASGRPNLLCKALRMVVGIVKGERRPEIPDMFQIRGFDGGNVRSHVSSESFTQKVHFMSAWRDLSRVWYNWEVLTLVNRRLYHRPTGFKYEGLRKKLAELICSYTLNANSLVSCVATECLQAFLKVHYGAKRALLQDCFLPLQEQTIQGASQMDSEKAHLAEAALQGFARTAARMFISGAWRRGAAAALRIATLIVRLVHAYTEEGKTNMDVRPVAISMQFELIAKWSGAQAAANPGDVSEACELASSLFTLMKQPGVHWRTKVCILATAGSALRVLHLTDKRSELDVGILRQWLGELLSGLTSATAQPQLASVALAELTTALRSALRNPGSPLDKVLQELIPQDKAILAQVAKTMSGLHQGHMGADAGAVATADTVQCVVQAASGRLGVPHLAWAPCPSGHAWTIHAAFIQTYVAFCAKRAHSGIIQELKTVLGTLQSQPKSEAEDHVVFIEILGGALRAARRWPAAQQKEFWAAAGPIAAEELRTAEEDSVRNWQFLVYLVVCGVSRRLRPKSKEQPSEDSAILLLACFLAGALGESESKPVLAPAVEGDGENSSHLHATRLRLLQVLFASLQRRTSTVSNGVRIELLQGAIPALKQGISHPYKQVHEESAKALVLSLLSGLDSDLLRDLRTWIREQATQLAPAIRNAPKDSSVSTACEGLVYVFIHGLLGRRLRSLSLESADLLLAAASADDHELRALAGLALGCLGQSPHRSVAALSLGQSLVACCRSLEGEDVNSASRSRRLEAAAAMLGASALRHDFAMRMPDGGRASRLCRDALVDLLSDKRVEVRIAGQTALAPMLSLESTDACRKQARSFATLGAEDSVDRAVHGLGALLRAAGNLGVPPWLGAVIEALSKVGRRPEAKKEVEKTVQAFLKQQQSSRDLWKRCQSRLTESQMDLLKARQGTMSYYS